MNLRRVSDPPDPHVLRALLVDDDPNYRSFVAALLGRAGITTYEAADGQAAYERVLAGESYDLLLIDYEMPRLNGLQLIEKLRQERSTATTYAVMLTGREDTETKIAALMSGFDDFQVKAATELELLAKVVASKRLIMRKQSVDAIVRELRGLASTDELTGLLNRRFFFAEAEHVVRAAGEACLVLFDLDRFKDINDTHGHLTGDQVLRDVAAVLREQTRYEDFVVRFGGDEFVMITHDLTLEQLQVIVQRIASRVSSLRWTCGNQTVEVGLTAGMATTSLLPERTLTALLDAADRDLYKNKYIKRAPSKDGGQYEYGRAGNAEIVNLGLGKLPTMKKRTGEGEGP